MRYLWNKDKDQFTFRGGTWSSSSINACANNSPDSVGVFLRAKHDFLTGLFSRGVSIDDHAVFTFEPLPTLTCASGSHG